jgi:ABC-type sugar transport system ATPase subunit
MKTKTIKTMLTTHNFEEMREIADRAIVLRRGEMVGSVRLSDASDDQIVAMITGSGG